MSDGAKLGSGIKVVKVQEEILKFLACCLGFCIATQKINNYCKRYIIHFCAIYMQQHNDNHTTSIIKKATRLLYEYIILKH